MNVRDDEVGEIAWTRFFRSGVDNYVRRAGRGGKFLDQTWRVRIRQVDRNRLSCVVAVAQRNAGNVVLFGEVIGQRRAKKTVTTSNPDVQVNRPLDQN